MKLAYWMYAGPAHIGTLRVASSFKNVHAIMHAPLGDDYFNVMRSMLERERDFTPVTASIVDRHVLARGSQEKVVENITRKDKEENPDLILLTPTCTSSILQEDLQNFVDRAVLSSKSDVILADVNHYRVNEFQAADRTLEQIVRFYLEKAKKENIDFTTKTQKPSANILGVFTLGFHNQHDCRELRRLLNDLGIDVNEVIPEGGEVSNLKNLPKAWFNFVPYREVGLMTAIYLQKEFNMPYVATTPMGLVETAKCIREIENVLNSYILNGGRNNELSPPTQNEKSHLNIKSVKCQWNTDTYAPSSQSVPLTLMSAGPNGYGDNGDLDNQNLKTKMVTGLSNSYRTLHSEKLWNFKPYIEDQTRYLSQAAWFSRSIDCQNLTGKKTVVFGDATHAAAMTKILAREMGIRVACAGTYCRHDADWFREQVVGFCDQVLITDDHTQVGDMIAKLEPSAIFGTQMERHVGKRLDIPCGVISAPVHIQNFPLGYRPFLGYEGSNQIADLVYNSFNLGMEEHLLTIFGGHDSKAFISKSLSTENLINWSSEAQQELQKVPGFVRNKVKIKTENYAVSKKINLVTLEVMYAAKEAVGA